VRPTGETKENRLTLRGQEISSGDVKKDNPASVTGRIKKHGKKKTVLPFGTQLEGDPKSMLPYAATILF